MNHLTEALIRKTADVKSHNEAAKHRRAFRNLSPEERVAVIQAPLHAYNVSMAALPGGGSAKPEASDAGGHAFGALLAAPFTMGYGGIKGGAVGAGIGGAAGASLGAALTWALMKNPETRDYITNSLIGGGLGAGAGVAVGAPVGAVREFGKSLDPGYLES